VRRLKIECWKVFTPIPKNLNLNFQETSFHLIVIPDLGGPPLPSLLSNIYTFLKLKTLD
jgi:hypothetical protein